MSRYEDAETAAYPDMAPVASLGCPRAAGDTFPMTAETRLVRIFVASPGDVEPERDALAGVIGELNRTLGADRALNLTLVRWETDAWPGFGEDAQDVINREIGEYDIFVGVMWKKLGTPTGRASSGTVEEFSRAFGRWQQHGLPKLMFYFSQQPLPPREARQVGEVLAFKEVLKEKGGLYWEYASVRDFERQIHEHLYKELTASFSQKDATSAPPLDAGVLDAPDASALVPRECVDALEKSFEEYPLVVVEGLRGGGKTSAVSYALYRTGVIATTLWVDAESGATLDDILSLLESRVQFKTGSSPNKAKELIHHLTSHDMRLVIDDYQGVVGESFEPLIKAASRVKSSARLVLVSRQRVELVPIVVNPCRVIVGGLTSPEIVSILQMRGISAAPERWIKGLQEQVDGLPIAVTLFATAVMEFGRDGDELLSGHLVGDGRLRQWYEDIVSEISGSSRGLLRFLSVADGSFSRSIVRAGGKHGKIAKVDVSFEVLQRAHLVQRYSPTRWNVHQLIGAFALSELEPEEMEDIHGVFGEYYLRRIVQWPRRFMDADAFAMSASACRHLQAAKRNEESQPQKKLLARTTKALGHFATFLQLCRPELDVPGHDPWLDYNYAHCCLLTGRLCEAVEAIQRADALSAAPSCRLSLARLHADTLDVAGHPRRALAVLLAAAKTFDDASVRVSEQVDAVLSRLYVATGDGEKAAMIATKLLTQARQAKNNIGVAVGFAALGFARLSTKNAIAARAPLNDALKLFESEGDRRGASWALSGVARVETARGDVGAARLAIESVVRTRNDLAECSAGYSEFLSFAQDVWPHGVGGLIDDEAERVCGLLESERRAFVARNLHVPN